MRTIALSFLFSGLAVFQAPSPVRYRVTALSPATVVGDVPLTMMRSMNVVTITARDSGVTRIWQLVVDSASNEVVLRDSLAPPMRPTGQLGPVSVRQTRVFRAYVRNGRLIRTLVDGRPGDFRFDAQNPQLSLLKQVPNLSYLPAAGFPRIGDSYTDTSATLRNVPTGLFVDSTVVSWTRASARLAEGRGTHSRNVGGRGSSGFGSVQAVLDSAGMIIEASITREDIRGGRAQLERSTELRSTITVVRLPM